MPPKNLRGNKGRFVKRSKGEGEKKAKEQAKLLVERARLKKREREEAREPIHDVGRRIVDLAQLAKGMWCSTCEIPLNFRSMEKEAQRGLASLLYIRCTVCFDLITVSSSTHVKNGDGSGYPLYAVNCKAATGCLDSGIGHEQLNNFLSALNCPVLHHKTMKRAEARVGRAFETAANESCEKAVLEEKTLTIHGQRSTLIQPGLDEDYENIANEEVGITVEYDFGWDKRGSGFTYDSKSGRGSVIGQQTKKILPWKVMSSACAMCHRGDPSDQHDCRKNHSGSAKAMEPQTAVDLIANNETFKKDGIRVDYLVGDEDASTNCHVQQQTAHHVEKWIDTNHTTKKFSNKLYTAARQHKFLTSAVIKYLKRCFCYAIAQNKDNVEGLEKSFVNIVKHTFGEHTDCGEWCNAKCDAAYVFKHLPNGKPFTCAVWRTDFQAIMDSYVDKAKKIAPGGSSQRNESFNHMAVTRAPKSRFYGSSPALAYRTAAAVLQKNGGCTHIVDVNAKAGLSPGGITEKYRRMAEERRKKQAARQNTIEFKRRIRLFLKSKVSSGSAAQRKEGLNYVSGMSSTMKRAVAATFETNAWIPEEAPLQNDCVPVLVDTETTGLGGNAEIIQLAARSGDRVFNAYMLPSTKINPHASAATGLTVADGNLYRHSKHITTTPSADVARDFLAFLHSAGPQVLLVGHNIIRFDAPLILKWLQGEGLARALYGLVFGFTDTVPLLRQGKMGKQEDLAKTFLTGPEWDAIHSNAHNAEADCQLLNGLLEHFKVSPALLKDKAVTTKDFLERQAMAKKQRTNLPFLLSMKGVVSQIMLSKMARHRITLDELKREYSLHGNKGIEVCLGVQVLGKPRVTTQKKTVKNVCDYIAKLFEVRNC